MDRDFTVVLRGYDRAEVDKALERAEAALHGGSGSERAASLKELGKGFTVVLRGYDRIGVDRAVGVLVTALSGTGGSGSSGSDGDGERLRSSLAAVLRLDRPSDEEMLAEVRRLRELADRS